MKITDLTIDPRSIGTRPLLVEVIPAYAYSEGKQQLDAPEGYAEVTFQNLEIYTYWTPTGYQVGARAKGIQLADTGKAKG